MSTLDCVQLEHSAAHCSVELRLVMDESKWNTYRVLSLQWLTYRDVSVHVAHLFLPFPDECRRTDDKVGQGFPALLEETSSG